MNIFILAQRAKDAAALHCDKHVYKMVLEYTQILYTVMWKWDRALPGGYKPTHSRHPCVLWAGCALSHFMWLLDLTDALLEEYTKRRALAGEPNKVHACAKHVSLIRASVEKMVADDDFILDLQISGPDMVAKFPELQKRLLPKVCAGSPPEGCLFGVVCGPQVCTDETHTDCVSAYRAFIAHKAKTSFPVTWNRSPVPPPELEAAYREVLPEAEPLQRPSLKRKSPE